MATITGTNGNDTLLGTSGNDSIIGSAGDDSIIGGGGGDTIDGGIGQNVIDGGLGYNVVDYATSEAGVSVSLTRGLGTNAPDPYSISSGVAYDRLHNIQGVIGSNYSDSIVGDLNANSISGGGGDDTLDGLDGADTLTGGAGHDAFIIEGAGQKIVTDFTHGQDKIDVSQAGFSSFAALTPFLSQNGSDAVLSIIYGGQPASYTLKNVAVATMDAGDFIFAPSPPSMPFNITRISTSAAGVEANNDSNNPVFSPDGTKIAFVSSASNLVVGDTNLSADVFIKDLATGAVRRIPADNATQVVFSPDGTKVAFDSGSSALVGGDTNGLPDVFVEDLATGAITRVSTSATGRQADSSSWNPVFSPDGTKVAFVSHASNLVNGDTFAGNDVFVKDLKTGAITLVSTSANGAGSNGDSVHPVFSPDGTKVAFESVASNLIPGDPSVSGDVYIKNLATGAITRVSTSAAGAQANNMNFDPVFSPDGTKVAFESSASNLVAGATSGAGDVFIKDLVTGAVTLVSTSATGGPANSWSGHPIFSPDGTKMAFISNASNLITNDTNGVPDVFVKDLGTGAITMVSTSAAGGPAYGASGAPAFSPDGAKLAFSSDASNLIAKDTNAVRDVFVATFKTAPSPAAPVGLVLDAATDSGAKGDAITNQARVQIDGAAAANAAITLYDSDGKTVIGTGRADSSGAFHITTAALSDGVHSITATAQKGGGSSPASSSVAVTVDTAAPPPPSHLADVDVRNGYENAAHDVASQILKGKAEAGAAVTVSDGASKLGVTTADALGSWYFVLGHLSDGSHSLTATATDVAGNMGSASAPLAFTVDTVAPGAVIGNLVANGADPTTVILSGVSDHGAVISVKDNTVAVGTVTADASGAWTFTLHSLTAEAHAFWVTATDEAGNKATSTAGRYDPISGVALKGGAAADVIFGRDGDTLTGGASADRFVFNPGFGHQTITDFKASTAASVGDRIQIDHRLLPNFTTLLSHATQTGANVSIQVDNSDSLVLKYVQLTSLHAADFVFV